MATYLGQIDFYHLLTVAQLRQKCEKRGIEHDGLTKTGLMEALREVDLRDYYNECVRAERAAQQERQWQEQRTVRRKQKLERRQREIKRQQEIKFNEQYKTLFAMYAAMEHPAVDSYTVAVDCNDFKFVDDVFDVELRNDAQHVSVISDEIVTECVNEQMCALSQTDDDNCDGNVGLGAPLMAEAGAAAAPAAAPLQTEIIDLDNADGTLQTGDSINPTGKPELSAVIGDNDNLAFSDDRQAAQQQYAELINFAASDLEGGIGNGTDQGSSGVTTDSGSDAAEQAVIREFMPIIMYDTDENSRAEY